VFPQHRGGLDAARRLRTLATGSRAQAYRVEVAGRVASLLIGPGAERLIELEAQTRRRFFLVGKEEVHLDHFTVLAEGKRDDLAVHAPVDEGAEIELTLGEVGLHDRRAGVGKLDGLDVCVADAASLVGKKVKVRVERVLDDAAYATLVRREAVAREPITAEREAEKPTRTRASAKKEPAATEPEAEEESAEGDADTEAKPKKRTRRGSRGGRGRKKKATTTTAGAPAAAATAAAAENGAGAPEQAGAVVARIHVPDPELGAEPTEEPAPATPLSEDGDAPKAKKKTRRGTRGGRNRKRRTTAAAASESATDGVATPAADGAGGDVDTTWDYVPMAEWEDEIKDA
jgi:predicted RNA-binding protein with TRAM domain